MFVNRWTLSHTVRGKLAILNGREKRDRKMWICLTPIVGGNIYLEDKVIETPRVVVDVFFFLLIIVTCHCPRLEPQGGSSNFLLPCAACRWTRSGTHREPLGFLFPSVGHMSLNWIQIHWFSNKFWTVAFVYTFSLAVVPENYDPRSYVTVKPHCIDKIGEKCNAF